MPRVAAASTVGDKGYERALMLIDAGVDDIARTADLAWSDGMLHLSAAAHDVGSIADEIEVSHDGSFEGPVRFNVAFLSSVVEAAAADEVTFGFIDALKPAALGTGEIRQIIMPVRIGA